MSNQYPNQPNYYAPQQPQPKPKKKWPWVVLGVSAVVVVGFGGCAALVGNSIDEAVNSVPTFPPSISDPTGESPSGLPTSGVLKVGQDIAPGEYRWRSVGNFGSYYARLSCTTGELNCIITNNVPEAGATGYLTIEPSDVAVEVRQLELTPQ